MDTNRIRFLESAENIRALIRLRTGRKLSTSRAREITACLQQGRQFFEAAQESPLETRPLIQFYGMLGFARAIIIARQGVSLSTLARGHGLRDISKPNSRLSDLRVRIEASGTFPEFNDEVAAVNRACYFGQNTHPISFTVPCVASSDLVGLEVTLRDVLARVPQLSSLFRHTYGENGASESLGHLHFQEHEDTFHISIVDSEQFASREALRRIVDRWRARFPYLNHWRVVEASKSWGESYITLANIPRNEADDLSVELLTHFADGRFVTHPIPLERVAPKDILEGVGGGFTEGPMYAIEPVEGRYLAEFSVVYLGLFLLSSLVRYRPDIWAHTVSRSCLQDRPVDDHLLALIESFLEQSLSGVTQLVVKLINPHEDKFAYSGGINVEAQQAPNHS